MSDDDNLDLVAAGLTELVESFDFTRRGKDRSLGHTLIGVIHERISDRNRAEQDPDGGPWEANRGKYGGRKRADGVPVGVGHYSLGRERGQRTAQYEPGGEMTSLVQIQGEIEVEPDSVTSSFGTDDEVRRKGSWFTRGSSGPGEGEVSGAKNQPPRPFYGFNEDDADAVLDEAGRALDELLGD